MFPFKRFFFLTLWSFILNSGLFGLTPNSYLRFSHLTVENGLSHNKVNTICQDHLGFVWFGTNEGISRYDGFDFRTYRHDPGDSTTITSNLVKHLLADRDGNVWAGMEGRGLCVYDWDKDEFQEIKYNGNIPFYYTMAMCEDSKGMIWVGCRDTLFCLDRRTHHVVDRRRYGKSPDNNMIMSLYEDSRSNLWVGTNSNGLYLFNPETRQFVRHFLKTGNPRALNSNAINTIYEDRSGRLWIGTNDNGLYLFDYQDSTFHQINLDPDQERSSRIRSIVEDREGKLWVGTRSGLYLKIGTGNTFIRYAHSDHMFSQLGNSSVITVFIDSNEIMWVGTYAGGVSYADLRQKPFIHYHTKNSVPYALNDPIVFSFMEDHAGNLWVGTEDGGINVLSQKTGTFRFFKNDPSDRNSLRSNNIKAMVPDNRGNIWIGTYGGGLNYYMQNARKFVHFQIPVEGTHDTLDPNIYTLHMDSEQNLYIGTGDGLYRLLSARQRLIYMNRELNDTQHLLNYVRAIYEDHRNRIWIGTYENGLLLIDRQSNTLKQVYDDSQTGAVFTIYEDTGENLWFGSENGLFCIAGEAGELIHHTDGNGVTFGSVLGILEDGNQNLWISTSSSGLIQGIGAVSDPDQFRLKKYDMNDGLQGNQFNYNAYYKSKSGHMYFGGINGFNVFSPEQIEDNPYRPHIVITNLKIFNETVPIGKEFMGRIVLERSISRCDTVVLSYKDNVFTFDFTAPHYTCPEKNQFAYILEGFEKKWNTVGTRRSATYTSIDPGTYVFHVKGANSDGVWNEEGTSITVIITRPYWQTWWFYLIMFVCGSLSIITIHKVRTRAIQRRNEELQKINTELNKQMSERKRAEDAYRDLYETAPVGYHEIDRQGIIVRINQTEANLLGYTKDEMIGHHVYDFVVDQEASRTAIESKMTGKTPLAGFERKYKRKDGSVIDAIIEEVLIKDKNNQIAGIRSTVQDITLRKKAEQQYQQLNEKLEQRVHERTAELEAVNKELEAFSYSVSHDLREPLRGISGFSQILNEDYSDQIDEAGRDYLQRICAAVKRMSNLIDDLLKLSRLTRSKIRFEKVDLGLLADAAIDELLQSRPKRKIRFVKAGDLVVRGDKPLLNIMIKNLMQNAWKFTLKQDQPIIELGRMKIKNQTVFYIRDNGVGFDMTYSDKLFEVFQRQHNEFEGTGIGLATVQRIIRRHGGRIWAEGKVGEGATFFFTFRSSKMLSATIR